MDTGVFANIQQLEIKVLELIEQAKVQKDGLKKLQEENTQLQQLLTRENAIANQDLVQTNIDKIVKQLGERSTGRKKQLLGSYIKEIDQCIAFLEQMA